MDGGRACDGTIFFFPSRSHGPGPGLCFKKQGTGPRRTKLSSGDETASSCTTQTRFGADVRAPDPRLHPVPSSGFIFLGQSPSLCPDCGKAAMVALHPPLSLSAWPRRRLGLCWEPGISGIDKVWEEWRRVKKNEGRSWIG